MLPALANVFETSIDSLIGMDLLKSEETRYNIHKKATEYQRGCDYISAEREYRIALRIYPKDSGMLLDLAGVLALQGESEESIALSECGSPLSDNEKQKVTMRAPLCFLYLKCGRIDKTNQLASQLTHI